MGLGATFAQPVGVKIGDRDYEVKPIGLLDFAGYENHVKSKKIEAFLQGCGDSLPFPEKTAMVSSILNEAIPLERLARMAEISFEGACYLIWCGLKNSKGEDGERLSLEEIIENIDSLEDITVVVDALTDQFLNPTKPAASKKRSRPSTKRRDKNNKRSKKTKSAGKR